MNIKWSGNVQNMIEMADDSKCTMFEHEVLRFILMRLTESTIADLIPKFHYEVF